MDINKFWKLIESEKSENLDADDADYMKDALMLLSREEIESFYLIYQSVLAKLDVDNVYRLGCVLHEIDLSDDGFEYFQRWLILQGKKAVELAIDNPDDLANSLDLVSDLHERNLECESFCYFIEDAYEEKFDQSIYDFVNLNSISADDEVEREWERITYKGSVGKLPKLSKALGISSSSVQNVKNSETNFNGRRDEGKGLYDSRYEEGITKLSSIEEIGPFLLSKLENLPWFQKIGQSLGSNIVTISSWDEWLGFSDLAFEISCRHEQLLKNLNLSLEEKMEWKILFYSIIDNVKAYVPYKEDEDLRHPYAPNVAVWHAAWVFGLIELYRLKKKEIPQELVIQEYWFNVGHWPCAVQNLDSFEMQNGYIVY